MFEKLIKFIWPFMLFISSAAYSEMKEAPPSPPRGYVAICKTGNGTTVEPYEIHEARVNHGWAPFTPHSNSIKEVIEEVANRLAPFSQEDSEIVNENAIKALDKSKFLENVDVVLDENEIIPLPLQKGCEVKKLYTYHPPQLPYDFVFDANLWNAMSSAGKAATLANIGLSLTCDFLSGCGPRSEEKIKEYRTISAFSVSSNLSRMSAKEWFAILNDNNIMCVVYKGVPLEVYGSKFSSQTGSLESANFCGASPLPILGTHLVLKGSIEFYPNESIHRISPSTEGNSFYENRAELLGGLVELDPECEIELSEDQKPLKLCVKDETHLATDHYDITLSGEATFHPSGYVNEANGVSKVELNGRIVQVRSSNTQKLHFDSEGNIMSGTFKTPVKIHGDHGEYELAPLPFTAYSGGHIHSAFLQSDANLKDCTGNSRLFQAGTEIHFNQAEIPCEAAK